MSDPIRDWVTNERPDLVEGAAIRLPEGAATLAQVVRNARGTQIGLILAFVETPGGGAQLGFFDALETQPAAKNHGV